ncbi:MAG: hypothetical protein M3371_05345 [Acidobacteriota bacterium]|nr:hypothetical protein [Acidobacteriota bacterium]
MSTGTEEEVTNNDLHDFKEFTKQREDAARAFVNGEIEPLGRMVARVSPATFFSPDRSYEQGAEQVYSKYERETARFESGDSNFESNRSVS